VATRKKKRSAGKARARKPAGPARKARARRKAATPRATASALAACACVQDLEAIAKRRLSRAVYDYYAGGAEDEQTLRGNRDAFHKIFIRPRALVDVGRIDITTTALGTPITMPVMVAPTAYQRMANRDGELATARAAGEAGTIMVASTIATHSLEEIAKAATGPLWFQLYVQPDRSISRDLAHRAEAAGYSALCLTVDTPQLGQRERDVHNNFTLPPGIRMMNFEGNRSVMPRTPAGGSAFAAYASSLLDPTLTWDAIAWLRSETKLPIVVKGIISGEDAALAAQSGAAAILVSNHGGRQLDACEPTLAALPHVVEAVAGRVEVYLDGGVRRGTDIIKALALGARAVLVGRPVLWGLAAGGKPGVVRALEMLRAELVLAMTLAGLPSLRSIGPGTVVRA
jgi:4-hydroxymandelate oxidase